MALQLLTDGWDYHATETDRLAGELEAAAAAPVAADDLAPFARLGVHTIGEHLEDWPRAQRLAERLLAGRTPDAASAEAWAQLWIARLLAGDPAGAAQAELAFLGAGSDFRAGVIEARFMLVAALVNCGRTTEATALYDAALGLADALGAAAPARPIAVASNNLGWELVKAEVRTGEETALMEKAAAASQAYWRRAGGDWVNEEIALQLRAQVALVLGRAEVALALTDEGLAVINANSPRPIDTALLRLQRSLARTALGDAAAASEELALADASAAAAPDEGLRAWYAEERAKALG